MATYLETYDGSPFTELEKSFAAETAQALGLEQRDDRNFLDGKRYVGIRDDSIQVQGFDDNPEAKVLLALSAHATRYTTDKRVMQGDNTRSELTDILPIYNFN